MNIEEAIEGLQGLIRELEPELGMSNGFFNSLLHESDWAFVVKMHSLIEAAVTHLLIHATDLPKLAGVFAELPLSDNSKGKLAFVKALNLLDDEYRRFIKQFSELRNDLVHNVQNTNFNLTEYVRNLDPGAYKTFEETYLGKPRNSDQKIKENRKTLMLSVPKGMIHMMAFRCLAQIYMRKKLASWEAERREDLSGLWEEVAQYYKKGTA
jgi:hypothetical protein